MFFAWWMSVDVCMPLWSWTDGRGQTSAACVRALHMLKLGEVAGADAEGRTLGRWSARRVVGLVGFVGLFRAKRARRNCLRGGGLAGQAWGHIRAELGADPAAAWWARWVSGSCSGSLARGKPPWGRPLAMGASDAWVGA